MKVFLTKPLSSIHLKTISSLLLICLCRCAPPDSLHVLRERIESEFTTGGGTFAMAWKNLENGESLFINADAVFHAASTMKTPVMIEVYRQAAQGNFSLADSIIIKNEFYSIVDSSIYSLTRSEDSDSTIYGQIGQKRTIEDLVYDMIIVSSNLATNIIIDLVDAQEVTRSMQALGAANIEILRGVEDIKAFEAGLSNRTTARDLLVIFEQLATGHLVDSSSNERMIQTLLNQQFNDVIPAHLPQGVKVAHKTGSITGVHHDSGIVILPDGRKYILVLLSKDLIDFDQGTATLARVSKFVYDYLVSE